MLLCRQSTQQEIASIQLVNSTDGECAFSAVISAVSKSAHRKTSMVLAENKGTVNCVNLHVFEQVGSVAKYVNDMTVRQ